MGDPSVAKPVTFQDLLEAEQNLSLARRIGDISNISSAYNECGNLARHLEKYEAAIGYHQKAVALCRSSLSDEDLLLSLRLLGIVYYQKGDYNKSMETYKEGLRILEEGPNILEECRFLYNLALVFKQKTVVGVSQKNVMCDDSETDSEDDLFIFGCDDDLEQAEYYFRQVVILMKKHPTFDFDDVESEISRMLDLADSMTKRFYYSFRGSDFTKIDDIVSLYNDVLFALSENDDVDFRLRIQYKKAKLLCLMGEKFRIEAIDLLSTIVRVDCQEALREKAFEVLISFFLQIADFSSCQNYLDEFCRAFPHRLSEVKKRKQTVQKINDFCDNDPSEEMATICCEHNEFRVANNIYSDNIRIETNISLRTELWLDKEAALERWGRSNPKRKQESIISEVKFSYQNCIKELEVDGEQRNRLCQVLLEYAKYISHSDPANAKSIYNKILGLRPNIRMESLAQNALERLKSSQSGTMPEIIGRQRVSSEDSSTVAGTRRSPRSCKKGQAQIRRRRVRERVEILDEELIIVNSGSSEPETDAESTGSSSNVNTARKHALTNARISVDAVNITEAEYAAIATLSFRDLKCRLDQEKRTKNRPAWVASYNFHIGCEFLHLGQLSEAINCFNQALSYRPLVMERDFPDFRLIFFNRGRAYRKMCDWKRAIEDEYKAVCLFEEFDHDGIDISQAFVELGHVYLEWGKQLTEVNHSTDALLHCLGRKAFEIHENAKEPLYQCKQDHRYQPYLMHILYNQVDALWSQEKFDQAFIMIEEYTSRCRQYSGVENWLCNFLDQSFEMNKQCRRFTEAEQNLNECMRLAERSSRDPANPTANFDYDNVDISETSEAYFGLVYWRSKLNFANLYLESGRLKQTKVYVEQLSSKRSVFQSHFLEMVTAIIQRYSVVIQESDRKDRLVQKIERNESDDLIADYRRLCEACNYIKDYEHVVIFAKQWVEMRTEISYHLEAIETLADGYRSLRDFGQSTLLLRQFNQLYRDNHYAPYDRFWALHKLLDCLYNTYKYDSSEFKSILEEMGSLLPHLEGSSDEFMEAKAVILDFEFVLSVDEHQRIELDKELLKLLMEWNPKPSSKPCNITCGPDEFNVMPKVNPQVHRKRIRDTRSVTPHHNLRRKRASHVDIATSRPKNRLASIRKTGDDPVSRIENSLAHRKNVDQIAPSRGNNRMQRHISRIQKADDYQLEVSDNDDTVSLLMQLETEDVPFVYHHEPVDETTTRTSAAPVLEPSVRVRLEDRAYWISCSATSDIKWLTEQTCDSVFRNQGQRPSIKHLLLKGAIIDSTEIVFHLLRSVGPDDEFVAEISHWDEIPLAASYQSTCDANPTENICDSQIVSRILNNPSREIDISFIMAPPCSISPLIKCLPEQRRHLVSLVMDYSAFNDLCANSLCACLNVLIHLEELSLANVQISSTSLATVLRKCKNLKYIDVHGNSLSGAEPGLTTTFFQSNVDIVRADFSCCSLKSFIGIGSSCRSLRTLNIAGNCFSDIQNIISSAQSCPVLEEFDLSAIGNINILDVCKETYTSPFPLSLRMCQATFSAGVDRCEDSSDWNLPTLLRLDLSRSVIDGNSFNFVCRNISTCFSLKYLSLNHCQIFNHDTSQILLRCVLQSPSLCEISLINCGFDDNTMQSLIFVGPDVNIWRSSRDLSLDLSYNSLTNDGIRNILGLCSKKTDHCIEFILDNNIILSSVEAQEIRNSFPLFTIIAGAEEGILRLRSSNTF